MTDAQKPLIIKDFEKAVADSPHLGHGLMNNIDIESFPGAMKVQKKFISRIIAVQSGRTFTANAGTDICTASAALATQALSDRGVGYTAAAVTFTTTGTLPAGLSLATTYFLISQSSSTFKVATSKVNAEAGTAIDITDAGTGVHTVVPVPIGTFNHIRKDSRASIYFALDSAGRVWFGDGGSFYLLTGNTITNTSGNGLSLFRTSDGADTYMFVYRNNVIDVIKVTATADLNTPVWSTSWQSMNTAAGTNNTHYAIVGQDNITYFCDARFVGSIVEKAGQIFDPANAATYTFNNQALDTPQDEIVQCLEELGVNLLIGGKTYNKIYPWDRVSDSYNLPLFVPEVGIYRMKNLGSTVYILAGLLGNVYSTQGTYVKLFKSIPVYLTNNAFSIQSNPVTWGGIAARNSALLVGLSCQVSGNSGVYIVYPDGKLVMDNTPYGGSQQVNEIYADNNLYYMGYNGGLDGVDTSALPTVGTYAAVYQSGLYRVGNKTQKAAYSQLEVQLATPATSGQIRVKYRFNKSSTFADFPGGAIVYAADGATISFESDIGLIDVENVQLQAEFDSNIELMEIRLYP